MNKLKLTFVACGLAFLAAQAMAANGIVVKTNPPETKGIIERTDDASRFVYNVRAGHTEPKGTRFSVGDRVEFTLGRGRVARNVRGENIVPNRPAIFTFDPEPDFSMVVLTNSVTFDDGSKSGFLDVTDVVIRCISPTGRCDVLEITVVTEAAGVEFDPPAPVTFPNIEGLPPGVTVDLLSFDRDAGGVIGIGTGTVSEDGHVITSDPGVGIRAPG